MTDTEERPIHPARIQVVLSGHPEVLGGWDFRLWHAALDQAAMLGQSSEKGKSAVRQNSTGHGLLAKALVFSNDAEGKRYRSHLQQLCNELSPATSLEMSCVVEIATADWRLKRVLRWEQRITMGNNGKSLIDDALDKNSEKLGLGPLGRAEGARNLRCKEVTLAIDSREDTDTQTQYTGVPASAPLFPPVTHDNALTKDSRAKLNARLTDPLDELDRILRYERAICKDRDSAIARLMMLQEWRRQKEKRGGK